MHGMEPMQRFISSCDAHDLSNRILSFCCFAVVYARVHLKETMPYVLPATRGVQVKSIDQQGQEQVETHDKVAFLTAADAAAQVSTAFHNIHG